MSAWPLPISNWYHRLSHSPDTDKVVELDCRTNEQCNYNPQIVNYLIRRLNYPENPEEVGLDLPSRVQRHYTPLSLYPISGKGQKWGIMARYLHM